MSTTNTQSLDFNGLKQSKDKDFQNQKEVIFEYLKRNTATASMKTSDISIQQKSIFKYGRELEKLGKLYEIEKKLSKLADFFSRRLIPYPGLLLKFNLKKALENGSK